MRKFLSTILILAVVIYINACGRKQQSPEEMDVPLTMEELSTLSATAPLPQPPQQLLPPPGPYKPTDRDIQTALKNAGYYTGVIDGKIGPLTEKAIEAFQRANGLKVDGKVGPKTWVKLGVYLNSPVESGPKKK